MVPDGTAALPCSAPTPSPARCPLSRMTSSLMRLPPLSHAASWRCTTRRKSRCRRAGRLIRTDTPPPTRPMCWQTLSPKTAAALCRSAGVRSSLASQGLRLWDALRDFLVHSLDGRDFKLLHDRRTRQYLSRFCRHQSAFFGDAEAIKKHLSTYLEELRESPKAEGRERIYTHGERRSLPSRTARQTVSPSTITRWSRCLTYAATCTLTSPSISATIARP